MITLPDARQTEYFIVVTTYEDGRTEISGGYGANTVPRLYMKKDANVVRNKLERAQNEHNEYVAKYDNGDGIEDAKFEIVPVSLKFA